MSGLLDLKLRTGREIPYLQAAMYYCVYYINMLITTFFGRFTEEDFRRFSERCPKASQTFPIFCETGKIPKIAEDFRVKTDDVSIIPQHI